MSVCQIYKISYLDFGYAIVPDFYNFTLEDVLAHDIVDLTLAQKVLKYLVVGLILLHTEVIFHGYIKPWSIVQCGSLWKLTEFHYSHKIGNATHNSEKYNWGYWPPEVAVTLLYSEQMRTFSVLPTYDIWSLGCIIYHIFFGYPLCNVDSKQINRFLSVFCIPLLPFLWNVYAFYF